MLLVLVAWANRISRIGFALSLPARRAFYARIHAGNDGIWCFGGSTCLPAYCPSHVNPIQGLYANLAASFNQGPCPSYPQGDLWVTKVGVQLSEYCFEGDTPVYIHVSEPGVTIVDDLVVVLSYTTATPPDSDFVAPSTCTCTGSR